MQRRMFATFHHLVDHPSKLSECVANSMNVSVKSAMDLISLGSVYHKSNSAQFGPTRYMTDIDVEMGDYIRVYPDTTRYDTDSINWKERVIFENDDFVVVNKPPGK
jgi:23S rRNA-/tRNA-specific pseudouridylate synthase